MSNSWSQRRKRKRPPVPVEVDIKIDRLGSGGDGISDHLGKPVYAPGLLPGEKALVRLTNNRGDGRIAEIITRHSNSLDRITPICLHAESCGGCSVQHLSSSAYLDWKEDLLTKALSLKGLVVEQRHPIIQIEDGRRRLRFAAIGTSTGAVLGFNSKASRKIVGIEHCHVAIPELTDIAPHLRPLLNKLLGTGEAADLEVRNSVSGLDVLLVRARELNYQERVDISSWMSDFDGARFAWLPIDNEIPEIIIERRPPSLDINGMSVTPPPGAFLQPTAAGEAFMAKFVAARLEGASHVADLFSGWGAFALRIAGSMHVQAYEGSELMISSLNQAAGAAGLRGYVTGFTRDLERQPLLENELSQFDAIVLDPPRAGAFKQSQLLAAGGPNRIVYLSCSPIALARDAQVLVNGGYHFREAQPIDQFRWTPHLEVACLFEREN
ncbi:MAG: hypothetical protein VW521_12090 [Rhodospirillales bacterium]